MTATRTGNVHVTKHQILQQLVFHLEKSKKESNLSVIIH